MEGRNPMMTWEGASSQLLASEAKEGLKILYLPQAQCYPKTTKMSS